MHQSLYGGKWHNMKTCKKCLLHSQIPNVFIGEDDLCQYCSGYNETLADYKKKYAKKKFENLLDSIKKQTYSYDCAVLFSGGKDSTALLQMAKKQYHLNPLAVSGLHPLVNKVAQNNIRNICKQYDIELLEIWIKEEDYKKIIHHAMVNADSYNLDEFMGCYMCSNLFKWVALQYVMKLGIPLLLDGTDASQTTEPYYMDGEKLRRNNAFIQKPLGVFHDVLKAALRERYYSGIYEVDEKLVTDRFPSIVAPFTFMEEEIKISEQKEFKKIFTNCDAVPFFSYFSIKKYDCVPYIRHYSNELRTGNGNILQLRLENGKNDLLDRERYELILNEYKSIVLYIVENFNINKSICIDEELLMKMAPTYLKVFGEEVCKVLLDSLLQIPFYAKYFNIPLGK